MSKFIIVSFFIAFSLNLYLAIYSYFLDSKRKTNKIFSFLLLSIAWWSFTFFMTNISINFENALFWRKASSFGWGTTYSFLLHFILSLVKKTNALKKFSLKLMIYGPAIFNVIYFGTNSSTANEVFKLYKTPYGWSYPPSSTFGDIFFNFYYVSFSIYALYLLYKWREKSKSLYEKHQAKTLFYSLLSTITIGTVTDVLLQYYSKFRLPSVAPIAIIIFTYFCFTIIKKYNLLDKSEFSKDISNRVILINSYKTSYYAYISSIFLIIGIGIIINYLANNLNVFSGLKLSMILLAIGSIILTLPKALENNEKQEKVLVFLIIISIPFVLLRYANQYGSNLLWVFSLIMLIATVPLKNKKAFYYTLIAGFLSIVYTWITSIKHTIEIGNVDYISRLIFLIILALLSNYTMKIFSKKIHDSEKQTAFQKGVIDITEQFLKMKKVGYESYLNILLKQINEFLDPKEIGYIRVNNSFIVKSQIIKELLKSEIFQERLTKNETFLMTSDCTHELIGENRVLFGDNMTIVIIPIYLEGNHKEFIYFCFEDIKNAWFVKDLEVFNIFSNILIDVQNKISSEKQLDMISYYDELTGLPNKNFFEKSFIELLKEDSYDEVGLLMIDIDDLKNINNSLSHSKGDLVIKEVSFRLRNLLKANDILARFGGDEFLILIPDLKRKLQEYNLLEEIRNIFKKPISIGDNSFIVRLSGGLATYPKDGETLNTLLKNADLALTYAKENGKNIICNFESFMKKSLYGDMMIKNYLINAIKNKEFSLMLEPKVSLSTGKISGAQVTPYWNNLAMGNISNKEFMPLAEELGMLKELYLLIFKEIKELMQEKRGIKFSVKVPINLLKINIVEIFIMLNENNDFDYSLIELELCHDINNTFNEEINKTLEILRNMGVTISLDNLGGEQVSLEMINKYHLDKIKISEEIIDNIISQPKASILASYLIDMAKKMELVVVATGVKTKEQFDFLKNEKCDKAQGSFIHPIMTKEEFFLLFE